MLPVYILIFAIVVAVIVMVPVFGGFGKKSKPKYQKLGSAITLDKKFVQEKWQGIEQTFNLGGSSRLQTAIIEADKLADYALKSRGAAGETMGERLKDAKKYFTNYSDYDNLWYAHKVRNNIAHETSHELGIAEAKRAIEYFKKALKILGAL